MNRAVTDSHALIWHITNSRRRLGPRARAFFDRAERGAATVFIPTFALVEIAEAAYRGALRFDGGFSRWMPRFLDAGRFVAADLTTDVVLAAEGLYVIPERGDRLIAATASHLGLPLITKDPAIGQAAGVQTIW